MPERGDALSVDPDVYDRRYFLDDCEGHREFLASGGGQISRRLSIALESAEIGQGMRVLDIGCGRGESLTWSADKGALAWGIDYAPEAINLTRETLRHRRTTLQGRCLAAQANARNLPFASASFDRVLMLDVVEHLYPWELDAALDEVWRVLKPGGTLIVHTAPNIWYYRMGYPLFRLFQRLQGVILPRDPRRRHRYHFVHVNEQSPTGLWRTLGRKGFWVRMRIADVQERWRNGGRVERWAGWAVTRLFPLKWIFCNDIYAFAQRSDET